MKITAVLSLIVAAAFAFAPLVSAQQLTCASAANTDTLKALQIMNTVKRKTVRGGKSVVQEIRIKNTASTTATGLQLGSGPVNADLSYISAKGWGVEKGKAPLTWTVDPQGPFLASSLVNIPPKKTLKATITYTAAQCPTLAGPWEVSLGVQIPADNLNTCFVSATRPQFTIQKAKTCP